MANTAGPIEPMTFLKKHVGKMSRGQEKVLIRLTKLVRSVSVIREKHSRIVGRQEHEENVQCYVINLVQK